MGLGLGLGFRGHFVLEDLGGNDGVDVVGLVRGDFTTDPGNPSVGFHRPVPTECVYRVRVCG
jgi:hypothetical protein